MYFCHTVAINFDRCIQRFIWSRGPLQSACWMESVTEIKIDTSYLCIGSRELPSKPEVVKLCTTSPPPSITNNNAKLVKTARHTTHFFHDWVTGTFSPLKVFLLCCHVPGCHESALLDTLSRSRCEPHASNPELRSAYYTPNHLTLNWNQVSHSSLRCFISGRVSPFTRTQACRYGVILPWVLLPYKSAAGLILPLKLHLIKVILVTAHEGSTDFFFRADTDTAAWRPITDIWAFTCSINEDLSVKM